MHRRRFIELILVGLACRSAAAPALEGMLPLPDGARLLGGVYHAAHPEEADLARLVRALSQVLVLGPGGTADPLACLSGQVRADYRCGRTVDVGGWLLSLTEARLCALQAMI